MLLSAAYIDIKKSGGGGAEEGFQVSSVKNGGMLTPFETIC